MPLYDYKCTKCNNTFTVNHGPHDLVGICDKCGAGVKKIISAPFVIYRGGGFYTKDNASNTEQEEL